MGNTCTGYDNQFIGILNDGKPLGITATKWRETNQFVPQHMPSRCAYCKRVWVETDRTCPGCGAPKEE